MFILKAKSARLVFRHSGEPAVPISRLQSSTGALAGCGDNLWAEQTGGAGWATETVWPGDPVSPGGSQRYLSEKVLLWSTEDVSPKSINHWNLFLLLETASQYEARISTLQCERAQWRKNGGITDKVCLFMSSESVILPSHYICTHIHMHL